MSRNIVADVKAKKKRIYIMAGFCVGCFALGTLLAIILIALAWKTSPVMWSLTIVLLVAAFILKYLVNSAERELKELEKQQSKGGKAIWWIKWLKSSVSYVVELLKYLQILILNSMMGMAFVKNVNL